MKKETTCGIYKITSPSGRVYIGESKNIENRWKEYKKPRGAKGQHKLQKSFIKYGKERHTFEIIEECIFEDLLCRERYWQDFYNVIDKNKGLNCKLTECGSLKQITSEETREKQRESKLGNLNPMYNKKQSENSIKLRVEQISGEKHYLYGKSPNKESIIKGVETKKLLKIAAKGNNPKAEIVLCLQTGIFYDCAKDAAEAYNINYGTLKSMLNGRRKNKTNLIYLRDVM